MCLETQQRHKSGRLIPVEVELNWFEFHGQEYNFAFVRDITERKQTEATLRESTKRLEDITFSLADWVWEVDEKGVYTYSSQQGFSYFGPAREDVIGKTPFDFMPPDEAKRVGAIFAEAAARKAPIRDLENWNITKSGERICLLTNGVPILDEAGNLKGYRGVDKDITERKRTDESLQSTLREKEALLKEVHHRVKNNLQVITSLLRMEARRSEHTATKSVLQEMTGRILSMALLHESLYRSGTFAAVDLGAYLKQLTNQSFRAQIVRPGSIRLQLELTSGQVEMDQALPCGLLANELISNCLKHGFPGDHSGEIRVELQPVEGGQQLRLRVSDTGVGLPADFEAKRGNSLGLQLVSNLVRQIDGRLEVGPGPGATFDVTFTPKHSKPTTSSPPP